MEKPIETIIHALQAGNRPVALQAFAAAGAAALEPLIDLLHHSEDLRLRSVLAAFFDEVDDPRIVPALLYTLEHDDNGDVQLAAIRVLARHPDARAVEPLIAELKHQSPEIREEATRALGEIGAALGSSRVGEALAGALQDSDWGTRQSAAEMLIGLNAEAAEKAEQLLLTDLRHDDVEIRLGAACSLAVLGDERALDPLVRLLYHSDSQIAQSAAYGLGTLADQRAATPLTAALAHQANEVQRAAAWALRQLNRDA